MEGAALFLAFGYDSSDLFKPLLTSFVHPLTSSDLPYPPLRYAQLATEIHAVETMVYNACRLKEAGLPFVKEASMVKLYSSQVAEKVASKCIELAGGVGFTTDFGVEKFYRDCKVGSIYEGSSNIQLQTIAKILNKEY